MGKYYRNSAVYPNECMFFIQSDFKALIWEGRGKLPNYRDWLFKDADLTSLELLDPQTGKMEMVESDPLGKVDFGGVSKQVCLEHVPDVQIGEYVLVHVGFALSKVDEDEARATLRLLEQMGAEYEQELEELKASVIE